MNKRQLICIGCPLGCQMEAEQNEGGEVVSVKGNTCPRGDAYARKELTCPTRIVTSTVRVEGGARHMVPVKTKEDVPKEKIFDCMGEIRRLAVTAPVAVGDVLLPAWLWWRRETLPPGEPHLRMGTKIRPLH